MVLCHSKMPYILCKLATAELSMSRSRYLLSSVNKQFIRNLSSTTFLRTRSLSKFPKLALLRYSVELRRKQESLSPVHSQVRRFHLSNRYDAHPFLWVVFGKPVTKLFVILSGRSLRNWWKDLNSTTKLVYAVASLGLITTLFLIYFKSHTQVTPITERERFIAFTPEQFLTIVQVEVENELEQIKNKILPASDPRYLAIFAVASRLYRANMDLPEMQNKQWKVYIVDDNEFNAHVYPTGEIIVNTGVFRLLNNLDQIAVIIGHEMSHALLSHSAEQVSHAQMQDFLIITIMAAIWMIIPSDGIAFITQWFMSQVFKTMQLPYSRKLELEADRVGLLLAAKACFDIREATVVWKLMSMKETIDGTVIPEFMSTHPASEKRVEFMEFLLPGMCETRDKCQCPKLPALDPRTSLQHVQRFVDDKVVALQAKQNLSKVQMHPSARIPLEKQRS